MVIRRTKWNTNMLRVSPCVSASDQFFGSSTENLTSQYPRQYSVPASNKSQLPHSPRPRNSKHIQLFPPETVNIKFHNNTFYYKKYLTLQKHSLMSASNTFETKFVRPQYPQNGVSSICGWRRWPPDTTVDVNITNKKSWPAGKEWSSSSSST